MLNGVVSVSDITKAGKRIVNDMAKKAMVGPEDDLIYINGSRVVFATFDGQIIWSMSIADSERVVASIVAAVTNYFHLAGCKIIDYNKIGPINSR